MTEKRDLAKDLEICEKATPGPWMHLFGDTIIYTKLEDGCRGLPVARIELGWRPDKRQGNFAFIAAAREGWPHAIKRAINAEAELARLHAQDGYVESLEREVGRLKGRLEKVIKTASSLTAYLVDTATAEGLMVEERLFYLVTECNMALAAYDGEGNGHD